MTKRYEVSCEVTWSMREMKPDECYFEHVNGSPIISLSTCVEVEYDESIAFSRGQLRILDAMGPDYKLPPTPTPKLDALQKERDELVRSGQRKKSFTVLHLMKEKNLKK